MRQFVDAYAIANTIRMSMSQHRGVFAIVEGSSDALVYQRFVADSCRIVPALGKTNATGALKILEQARIEGIIAVIDSDFAQLDNARADSPNLFMTDTHDLETMILASAALDKVIDEFCIEQRKAHARTSLRTMLLTIGKPLGFFRWISSSQQENLSCRFRNLDFRRFIRIEGERVSVNLPQMVHEVRLNTRTFMYREQEIVEKLEELLGKNHYDPWHICRGHDLVAILAFLLRDFYGNRKAKGITPEIVDSLIRLSYEYRFFRNTRLCIDILHWEAITGKTVLFVA